jgi:beta-lactamase regulating signal transducer with metallopeptidase domain
MNLLAHLLSPETMRLIALALLHFLWQGTALAALAFVLMMACRKASTRYVVAVATLVLMIVAPLGTFFVLQWDQPMSRLNTPELVAPLASPSSALLASPVKPASRGEENSPAYFLWLVEVWFAGVMILGLRSAGGFLMVERLRRNVATPIPKELLELCASLEKRMGLDRLVRYAECLQLDAPAVAGWMRPVVLLPVSALTGLTAVELEAVIAHELAHIKRLDAFVNLFQIAVETFLFYHPVVWWLGKRIREERENCCDDEAVAICGSPVVYAHALTRMAEWRAAPQLVMAVNRSSLATRVARLLGLSKAGSRQRVAGLSAGVLCLSAALVAGSALIGIARNVRAQSPSVARAATSAPAVVTKPDVDREAIIIVRPNHRDPLSQTAEMSGPGTLPQSETAPAKQSYIDELKSVGLDNLTVEEIVALKEQGVTPEYVRGMRDLGLPPHADELIALKVQGITPNYIHDMRSAIGESLDADALIGLKVQGVTAEYLKQLHEFGLKTGADEIIGMKVQGITPDYIRAMRSATGESLDADALIGLKVQGVSPDYIKQLHDLGVKADADNLIGMKVQGITPEYVKSIKDLGLQPNADELIGMKVQGISASYLKELQSAGFKLDVDEAIGAKVQGITPEFIHKAESHGFKNLTLDQLISLKHTGVLDAEK